MYIQIRCIKGSEHHVLLHYSLNSNTDMKIRGKTQGETGYTRRTEEEGLEVPQLGKSTQGVFEHKEAY